MPTLAQAALDYASRGWRVIALHNMTLYEGESVCSCARGRRGECRAPAKHPRFSKWRDIGTTDPERLASWWRFWPRANVGILMGGQAGLVCLDIDGDEGREALAKLEEANGALPETLMQSTGKGNHYLFHIDPFYCDWIKNRAKVAPGIDVRSEGGLIVAAPSIHPSGAVYRWINPGTPLAELPEWLFKVFISEKKRQTELSSSGGRPSEERLIELGWTLERRLVKARAVLEEMPPAIQGQNGSSACISAASAIVRGYCVPVEPHNHAFDLMWQVYNPRCQPPWADWELMHKIEDAEYKSDREWGYRFKSDSETLYSYQQWTGVIANLLELRVEENKKEALTKASAVPPKEVPPSPTDLPLPSRPKLPKSKAEVLWSTYHPLVSIAPEEPDVELEDGDEEDCA